MRSRARASLLPVAVLVAGFGGGVAAAGCLIDWADDCEHSLGYPGCMGAYSGSGASSTGTGTGAGAGVSSSTTQSGGGGTDAGCSGPSSCPPVPPGPCASLGMATCTAGQCGITYTAGPAPSQVYGNCKTNVCADDGGLSTSVDPTNVFQGANPCNLDECTDGGVPLIIPMPGKACLLPGSLTGFCEPSGDPLGGGVLGCAECDPSNQLTCAGESGTTCVTGGKCVPMHCTDDKQDFDETGIDCGGTDCVPCLAGGGCASYKDCTSLVCIGHVCIAPSCTDGTQNGTETDKDCGGASCPACADGLGCSAAKDCVSKVCAPPTPGAPDTCQKPTCFDGVQNGGETGIDCGGPTDGGLGDGDGGAPCPPCM